MNSHFKTLSLICLLLLISLSCSVDFSLLENRECDNEGRCLPGYVCDRSTMKCIKEGTQIYKDTGTTEDVNPADISYQDTEITDSDSDVLCTPSNNGVDICDGIDNNCNGQTDEGGVCGSCIITTSITEGCNENTKCGTCFIVNGEKYICVSDNGGDFGWKNESEIGCDPKREGYVIKCENRCQRCEGGKYTEPFTLQNESCNGKDDNCNGITDEGDICATLEICIQGKCTEKPCAKNEDCPIGKICKDNKCNSCTDITDDKLCGTGKICVNNACIEGNCHQDSDCNSGICVSNKCCSDCCRDKKDCPAELICKQGKCTQCIDGIEDISCGIGYICEDKKCIKGNCHPSVGCLSGKICVNYKCCDPGPACCNEDKHCKPNMFCNQSHQCQCKPPFGDCDNKYDTGCEKDLSNDINNCGICKQVCALPNADPQCIAGECQIKICKLGFKDCNNKPSDGCEINTTNDNLNCGDCNIECLVDYAKTKCDNSKCVIESCNLGYADCDGNYETGCETDILSDDNNCGSCNKKCDDFTYCANGICNP